MFLKHIVWLGIVLSTPSLTALADTPSCGTEGVLETRIEDCHSTVNFGQYTWSLVVRTSQIADKTGEEVWRDNATGILWGDLYHSEPMTWNQGMSSCPCYGSHSGMGIQRNPPVEWRLP